MSSNITNLQLLPLASIKVVTSFMESPYEIKIQIIQFVTILLLSIQQNDF